ncbi:hypothetical protein Tco_1301820 [Tanacetum coccineum]
MLDSQGPIPDMTPARALDSIQTMTNHSHKWHVGSSNKRTRSGSSDGIVAIISKLDSLERDIKKLKQNVHVIQVSCGLYGGTHLVKECPFNEEVKGVEEVKYGEFERSFPNNGGNGARYRVGPSGYYTRMDTRPSFGKKKLILEIEQLTKDVQAKAAKKAPNLSTSIGHYKAIFADNDAQSVGTCSNETKELHGVSFIYDCDVHVSKKENEGSSGVLSCQLHLKESNPGSFTLPCTIVEMADMSKKATMGIMENVLVKIDRIHSQGEKERQRWLNQEWMESEEVCERYITRCFVEGLDAVDGVTDLEYEKNLISYEFVVKLGLTYKVTENRDKVVDRKLLVSLKGELYFIDFILNPEEDDVETCVIFSRSFLKLAKAIINFGCGILTIWPETITINSDDDELDALLASINIDELLPINITDFPTFVCDMGKCLRNIKKKPAKTYKMRYDGEGPSLTVNCLKTQEELTREELEEDLYERIMLLNEKRPIIETLKYGDKHKMLLDSVLLDKLKLDDKEKVKPRIDKVRMLDHSNAETIGRLLNVLCQVGVTTMLANFMLLDVLVDRDVPIIPGRSFMYICGAIMNTQRRMSCAETIEEILEIKVIKVGGNEEVFSSEAWRRAFDINEPIYTELCHEFFATFKLDEEVTSEELATKKIIRFKLGRTNGYDKIDRNELWLLSMFEDRNHERYANVSWVIARWMKRKGKGTHEGSQIVCGQFVTKLARKFRLLNDEVLDGLRALIFFRTLDATTLKELIRPDGRLITEYRMCRMEVRQGVLERMARKQSYHSDRYARVFEHIVRHYGVKFNGEYAPPGYDEQQ